MIWVAIAIASQVIEIKSPLGSLKFDATTGATIATPPLNLPLSSHAVQMIEKEEEVAHMHAIQDQSAYRRSLSSNNTCLPRIDIGAHIHPNLWKEMTLRKAQEYIQLLIDATDAIWKNQGLGRVKLAYVKFIPEETCGDSESCTANMEYRNHSLCKSLL